MTGPRVVRFGAFADPHFAHKVYGDRHCEDSAVKLEACVRTFRGQELDFAVCLGDLVDGGVTREEERDHVRVMRELFESFPGPCHWVLGNHDVALFTKSEFLQACGSDRPAWYSFDVGPVHFVVLDGNCHADGTDFSAGDFHWEDAWISPAQVEWLEKDLAAASGRRAVILCHENLDDRRWNRALDPHVVRNAAQVRQVLEEAGGVTAVIQAHYHPGLECVQEEIPYLALRAMVVGPGVENNAFAVISVEADGTLDVEGYGRQRSWRVPGARRS